MLKKLLLAFAAVVLVFLGYVALQPPVGEVTRSALIAAPPAAVYPHVNDFHKWEAWSPWAKLDPDAKASYSGPASGVGAAFAWAGNSEVGKGKMTIVESHPNEHIKIKLDFEEPMASASIADFTFKPEGSGTRVTWQMQGERPFLARAMCILFRADAMVGAMFEKGLASLGTVATGKSG
jgi:hypothetical protein